MDKSNIEGQSMINCKRCGKNIKTFYKLRKWCFDCRKELINERARERNKRAALAKKLDIDPIEHVSDATEVMDLGDTSN